MSKPAAEALETESADNATVREATASGAENAESGASEQLDVDSIDTPAGYEAAVEALRNGKVEAGDGEGDGAGDADESQADEAEARGDESDAGVEDTEATAGDESGEGNEGEEDANESENDEGDGDDADGNIPKRIRLTGLSERKALAMKIAARNPDMSFAEAERRANKQLGISAETEDAGEEGGRKTTETKAEAKEGNLPDTVEGTKALIADLKAKRSAALGKDMNFTLAAELIDQIEAAQEHMSALREAGIRKEEQGRSKFEADVQAAKGRAVEVYPDVTKADSPLVAKMREIDAQLEADENPLFHSPDKYFKVAQMAANELGIAPRRPGTKTPEKTVVKKPAAKAGEAPRSTVKQAAPIAGAAARSSQVTAPQKSEEILAGVKDLESYEALTEQLRKQRR
jgi:hypothetical protein